MTAEASMADDEHVSKQGLEQHQRSQPSDDAGFIERVFLVFGIGTLFLATLGLLWFSGEIFLLGFSGILLAVLLYDASRALEARLMLSHNACLATVLAAAIGILALLAWLLAPQVAAETRQLVAVLPRALQDLRDYLVKHGGMPELLWMLPDPGRVLGDASTIAGHARSIFSGALGTATNVVIILFVAVYLAAQPDIYIRGFLKLLPPERRPKGGAVLRELGETLSLWLRGKLFSMAVIGVAIASGLGLLGVPLALALGLVAGLLDFIPYLGPILAAVPAVLIAFADEPVLAVYVIALFFVLHLVEGYFLLPLVERKTVFLPPALNIMMQVLMGSAFGLLGVALATPLTAVIAVLIAMLWVRDVLEDPVQLPGEQK
ncbi:AI-2E family transporter [Herbaspirillum sp. HC18]|nr:AI-2E family transporter [Herbaspirillum sp. HC18]